MGAKLRTVRRRIRSVQSTMKITGAISDVAAAASALGHPMLVERPDRRVAGVFVVTSDRGLAGGYNANVLKRAEELFSLLRDEGKLAKVFVSGRKGVSSAIRLASSYVGVSENPDVRRRQADRG